MVRIPGSSIVLSFILLLTVCISCDKGEVYSCNPEVDQWAKENKEVIMQMTRSDVITYAPAQQRAIYRMLPTESRQQIWLDKISETLLLEFWDKKEIEHLQELYSFVDNNIEVFAPNFADDELLYDSFDRFTYLWMDHAIEELGWTKKTIYSLVVTPNSISDKEGGIINEVLTKSNEISTEPSKIIIRIDCDCSQGNDWCLAAGDCRNITCSVILSDCGLFWRYDCNGLCSTVGGGGDELEEADDEKPIKPN